MAGLLIGSGYCERSSWDVDMAHLWYRCIRNSAPFPDRIAIISTGARFPVVADEIDVFRGSNLGHVGELTEGKRQGQLCGWSASVIALAMLAYNAGTDFVFVEADCLVFGNWLEAAYKDMGSADVVFGQKHTSAPWMPVSQSLFLIRHRFLLEFVAMYLALPSDAQMLPEHKFQAMENDAPQRFRRLSYGVDRCRPLPWNDKTWYFQQPTTEEVEEAIRSGMIVL